MAADLTDVAKAGFNARAGDSCPHAYSSPNQLAWSVGRWLQLTGRPAPHRVRMSRGYSLHVNDMLVDARDTNNIKRVR